MAAFLLLDGVPGLWRGGITGEEADRVALVRTDAIGDFVLWLDASMELVKFYREQGRRVTLLANSLWAAWAGELGVFDEVLSIDRRRFEGDLRYRLTTARTIRSKRFSTVVQPTHSRDHFGDSLVRVSGASERIGSTGDRANLPEWQKRISDRCYTRLIQADAQATMEIVRNASFVRELTGGAYRGRVADLRGLKARDAGARFKEKIGDGDAYFVVFPGASWKGKCWPPERFAALADRLYTETGWHGVVCGGPGDIALAEAVCRRANKPLLQWAGQTTLGELATIIARSQLLVSNDTAAVHLGAAVGVPTICVLGGGQYGRFLPYMVEQGDERPLPVVASHAMPCFGCDWHCIYPTPRDAALPCVDGVGLEEAWRLVRKMVVRERKETGATF